jgi:N-acetylglutamate synthase-like GNAT family acetyltransferase
LSIRKAKKSDKEEVLSFCSNTFDWGDYIDQVWDLWRADKTGRLLVAESDNNKIAMSHVAVCPDGKSAWLEGVRVHPGYRRSQVASKLIEKMVQYSMQKGARQASAIVAADNAASQRMMEKNGFEVISRWAYYSTTADRAKRQKSEARLATAGDLGSIWQYLQQSQIYCLSAKRYVKSWHWYVLDRKALQNFIKDKRVIMTGRPINGIAIINNHGYWRKKNILQIIYLDPASAKSLRHLVLFVTNLYLDGRFDRLQVLCHESKSMTSFFEKFMIKEEEQFLLYNKVFTP